MLDVLFKGATVFQYQWWSVSGRAKSPRRATHLIVKEAFRRDEILLEGEIVVLLKRRDMFLRISLQVIARAADIL